MSAPASSPHILTLFLVQNTELHSALQAPWDSKVGRLRGLRQWVEVGELAQLVRCLPHKHEDLNSIPRTQISSGKGWCTLVTPGEAETGGFQDFTDQSA